MNKTSQTLRALAALLREALPTARVRCRPRALGLLAHVAVQQPWGLYYVLIKADDGEIIAFADANNDHGFSFAAALAAPDSLKRLLRALRRRRPPSASPYLSACRQALLAHDGGLDRRVWLRRSANGNAVQVFLRNLGLNDPATRLFGRFFLQRDGQLVFESQAGAVTLGHARDPGILASLLWRLNAHAAEAAQAWAAMQLRPR